jgi:hypothetical protein
MTPDQQQALDIQNKGRANKGIKPMQWDGDLHNQAQEWYVVSLPLFAWGYLVCLFVVIEG